VLQAVLEAGHDGEDAEGAEDLGGGGVRGDEVVQLQPDELELFGQIQRGQLGTERLKQELMGRAVAGGRRGRAPAALATTDGGLTASWRGLA